MKKLLKLCLRLLVLLLLAGAGFCVAWQLSPWPGVFIIRKVFDAGAKRASDALVKHLPDNVIAHLDEVYDASSPQGRLDVFHSASVVNGGTLTTIMWIHGGGFVLGRKADVGNYCRILAGKGFTVVSVDYTIAPEAEFPTPLRQTNLALGWLVQHSKRFCINPDKIVLAGDSAGSHIASQLALTITSPAYASAVKVEPAIPAGQLAGMLLHCGVFTSQGMKLDGPFGLFLNVVLRSSFGTRSYSNDPRLALFDLPSHLTTTFPRTFISAGNADPLLPQSLSFAEALRSKGVHVEELFFPADHSPPLGHEYQFHLDDAAAITALERSVEFLRSL